MTPATGGVTAGLKEPVASPFDSALQDLVIGSPEFLRDVQSRLTALPAQAAVTDLARPSGWRGGLDRQAVYATVLEYSARPFEALGRRGDRGDWCRAVAAYLARRWTDATLSELATDLGLSRPESVPNLTRWIEQALGRATALQAGLRTIEDRLQAEAKTKNRV